jgi:hypothetical protein
MWAPFFRTLLRIAGLAAEIVTTHFKILAGLMAAVTGLLAVFAAVYVFAPPAASERAWQVLKLLEQLWKLLLPLIAAFPGLS